MPLSFSKILGSNLNLFIPPMCILYKLDYSKYGVSDWFLPKVIEENTFEGYLAKGGGGWLPTPSLNLNHCLSDLLLIVKLQTHPRSTRIQIKSLQYFWNAWDTLCWSCGVMSFLLISAIYVDVVKESDKKCYSSFIGQFNDLKSTG